MDASKKERTYKETEVILLKNLPQSDFKNVGLVKVFIGFMITLSARSYAVFLSHHVHPV